MLKKLLGLKVKIPIFWRKKCFEACEVLIDLHLEFRRIASCIEYLLHSRKSRLLQRLNKHSMNQKFAPVSLHFVGEKANKLTLLAFVHGLSPNVWRPGRLPYFAAFVSSRRNRAALLYRMSRFCSGVR